MRAAATPKWAYALLGANFGISLLLPVFMAATSPPVRWSGLWHDIVYSAVYGNSIALTAVLLMPASVRWLAFRRVPLPLAVAFSSILFSALGCLIGSTLLAWAGIVPPAHFWKDALRVFRGAVFLAVAFGLGAFFYERLRERLRQTTEKLHEKELAEERAVKLAAEARLHSLESRLRPHFLFNTLNSISALIAVDPQRAERLVGRLAELLRQSLDSTALPLIPLERELAMVEDYLDIEKARFGAKLEGRIEAPADLRQAGVPPFSIQSLVENAVKHGIAPQRGGGGFVVRARHQDAMLRIEVSDTGAGFDLAQIPPGHGLDNLVGRLDALFGDKARLNVLRRDGLNVVEMVLPRT
jgi:two-component system, LytTR family, sensor histidine kinase AlgZ